MKAWIKPIKRLHACEEALEWCEGYDNLEEAWQKCGRGDWMLWLAGRLSGGSKSASRKSQALAACECARLVLPYVTAGELRPLKAIETIEAWAKGEATLPQVISVAHAAEDAAYAAYVAANAARGSILLEAANIMRKHYPEPPERQRK